MSRGRNIRTAETTSLFNGGVRHILWLVYYRLIIHQSVVADWLILIAIEADVEIAILVIRHHALPPCQDWLGRVSHSSLSHLDRRTCYHLYVFRAF